MLFLGMGLNGLYEDHLFTVNADRTQGRVESSFTQAAVGRYGSNKIQRFLAYSYVIDSVNYDSGDLLVTSATWTRYGLHQPIPIIYLRDEPSNSRPDLPVEMQLSLSNQYTAVSIGAIFLVAGLIVIATMKPPAAHLP